MFLQFRILIFLLSLSLVSMGQYLRKYSEYADSQMAKGDYAGAVKSYRQAMGIDSAIVDVNYAYAHALRATNYYRKAAHYFKRSQRLDRGRKFVLANHYAGEMYKYLGEYSKSQKEHKRFLKRYKGDKNKFEYLKSQYEVGHSRDMIHLLQDTSDLSLTNDYEVNTPYSEFAAYLTDEDQLLYSALRSDSLKKRLVLDSAHYYSRIYKAANDSGWTTTGIHPAFHEGEQTHIANPVYSPKRDYVYYSECKGSNCQLFKARNANGEWTDFQPLPEKINLEGYTTSQPFVARIDGYDILFFTSDRPAGYGKLDIWYTIVYPTGEYENPINLGDSINSPGNDICPFYMEEEKALYFSSDWYSGLGGFDIFRSIAAGDGYFGPENLGIPFNSSYNDLYFRHFGNQAVLTSNREGSLTDKFENCCNDLFFFEYEPKSIVPEIEMTGIEKIERLLPLKLFFHNDEPNPRSQDTSTSILYSATYVQYLARQSQYKREYGKGQGKKAREAAEEEILQFFSDAVELGYNDLKEAMKLLKQELDAGASIELTIKGFASPLSFADYNRRLTLRRISSVINEFQHYDNGALRKYIDNGQLKIRKYPFGEDKLSDRVSDDRNDKRNAVYSKKASFERRVEIIAIRQLN